MTNSENLTLEEIGRLAGVSRSTVSRVLNDQQHVRPDVRSRVEAVIRETGYLPNHAARSLASNRSGLIGLVMPTDVDELFGDPYYSLLVHGIYEGCAESGTVFSIFPEYDRSGETTIISTLVARGYVDGVIVTAGPRSDRLISALRDRGKEMVVVGHPRDGHGVTRVDVENRAGSARAVRHLYGLGRTRIGFIGPTVDYLFGAERLDGYRDAVEEAGYTFDDGLVRLADLTADGGYHAAAELLAAEPDLDAVHVATDTMAVGALRALSERGRRVPDDVAVVGFDGFPNGPRTDPPLTTIVQPVVEIGRAAVQLLLGGGVGAAEVVVLPTHLHIGGTCGAPATSGGA